MSDQPKFSPGRCMAVLPCLDEAAHIAATIDRLSHAAETLGMRIVVVDGGSSDGTVAIVQEIADANSRVRLLHNPQRLQGAAVNLAVSACAAAEEYLIRIDAHGDYPADYCLQLVAEAERTGADSVVVAMRTKGTGLFQKATALAQNSRLGNGGSQHREGGAGRWTDHGHHALMRLDAFRAVGGYDETFSHNEDAELDYRLRQAGFRIWLTDRTAMTYFPRSSVAALFRQYLNYGRGRARNILKHRAWPRLRQLLPVAVAPVVVGTSLAFLSWAAFVPAGTWMLACVGYGVWMAVGKRNPYGPLAAVSAMIMHLAWSAGFWFQLLAFRRRRPLSP